MSSELDTLRKEIDNCDSELLDILSKRYMPNLTVTFDNGYVN